MLTDIHMQAIEMWALSKEADKAGNPSFFILSQLTNYRLEKDDDAIQDTLQLCQKINEIKGLPDLSEEERHEIQVYGFQLFMERKNSNSLGKAVAIWPSWASKIGYVVGVVSLLVGGFSWWVLGFLIGTWWAFGAATMASQKQLHSPGPTWEMPVHMLIHIIALIGLYGFSVYNIIY